MIGNVISSVAGFAGDNYMMEDQQSFNAREARLNREFQRNMSNTAYQRAARDLEKAGLNRIIALGSPAATPGGSMAQSGLLPAGSSAISAGASFGSSLESQEESRKRQDVLTQQADKVKEEVKAIAANIDLTKAKTVRERAEAAKADVQRTLYKVIQPYATRLAQAAANGQLGLSVSQVQEKVNKKISDVSKPIVDYIAETDARSFGSDVSDALGSAVRSAVESLTDFASGFFGDPGPSNAKHPEPIFEFE